jgi:RimJ/RimL family protein N-acetyltransferase
LTVHLFFIDGHMHDGRVLEATIRTDRLLLRAWRPEEAERVLEIYARDEVWPWLGAKPSPMPDLDAARARIQRWALLADGPFGLWAVEAPGVVGIDGVAADEPVGSVLLVTLPRSDGHVSDAVEVGWHLHPDAWGHGIATEAAEALLHRAGSVGISHVHAVVHPDNERSKAVCGRLGMTTCGRTTEWYGVELDDHCITTWASGQHANGPVTVDLTAPVQTGTT